MRGTVLSAAVLVLALLEVHAQCADGMLAPCGGERIANGASVLIRWNAAELPEKTGVELWLWDGERSRFITIAQNVPAESGSYLWQVPNELRGRLFRIQLRAQQRRLMSPTYFWIGLGLPSRVVEHSEPQENRLRILPNPASEAVELAWEGAPAIQLRLYDVYGRVRLLHTGGRWTSPLHLPVAELAAGAYAVELLLRDGKRLWGMLLRW